MLSNKPRNSPIIYFSFHFFLALASTLDWSRHWICVILQKEKARPENALPFLELALLLASCGVSRGLVLFFVMHMTSSWLLAVISFAVHRHEKIWTEGDENPRMDFGRHILASTSDHSFGLPLLPSLFGFALLNYHCLHHLFPTIDHSRLREVEPIFQKTCSEFGIEVKRHNFWDLEKSVFRRHDMFTGN
jgi:fatty acid desaturase